MKVAAISAATSGDNTLIAAVTDSKIRVGGFVLIAAGTVTVTFKDGAGGTALTGAMTLIAGVPMVVPVSPLQPSGQINGWFETSQAALLSLSLSGAVQVSGFIAYREVKQ